jgi:membrane protease YdiL (CAAX protease family)
LLLWTGNLWLPIIAHFVNNAAGVIIYFVTKEGLEPDQPDAPLFNNSLFFYAVASAVIVYFLLRYIYLKRAEKQELHVENFPYS